MELSDKIRIIRKARGLSQEALGDSLSRVSKDGISRQSVSDWENGKSEPKLDNIRDLAQVLNVSFDALLDESIDLNDQHVLASVLKHLNPEIKQTVNSKFRYNIRVSTLSARSFRTVIIDCVMLNLALLFSVLAFTLDAGGVFFYILLICGAVFLGLLPTAILSLIKIHNGLESVNIGELNNTHLIINTHKEAINTLYIPIDKIKSIQLGENQKLADVESGIDNMLNAIQQGLVLDSTKKRLSDLENRKKELEIEIAQEQIKSPILTREQIHFGLTKFRKLDLSTQKGKQTLIDGFVNAIYLFDDYAIVTCNYKDGEERITFEDIENSELGAFIEEQKNKPEQGCSDLLAFGDPCGNRTHDTTVKG